MKAKEYPSKEYLNKMFRYDPESGILYNRIYRNYNAQKDAPAGCLLKYTGYLQVSINHKEYYIHRIIWIMLNGSINKNLQIDHIDHNRRNNRLENLRLVTHAENTKNQKISKNNTSGHEGISWHKIARKWCAEIMVKGKHIYLGLFKDIEDAIEARKQAEIKYGFHPNHGRKIAC